jgi:cell division protease FtsH
MPEAIIRPVIINLWGMTGVGKTDLVRKLVKLLEMDEVFLEIQVSNNDSSGKFSESTISEAITYNSNIEKKERGILLVDEIQNFRDIDKRGENLTATKYQDLWTLLSDGRLPSFSKKSDVVDMLISFCERKKKWRSEESDKFHSFNAAKRIKSQFNLSESIEELLDVSGSDLIKLIGDRFDCAFETEDYSKLLIFISGNLDQVYKMADEVGISEIDADYFYQETKKIDFVRVKNCLTDLFKPEHISRLGNVHIIYPSFSKKTYQEIIVKKIDEVLRLTKEKTKVNIECEQSVYDFIYRNGVFPSQGIRPVLITISSYLENSIPKFLLFAFDNDESSLILSYCNGQLQCSCSKSKKILSVPWSGPIDKIKKSRNKNAAVLHSVHESGHAIMYALKFKKVPFQVISCSNIPTSSFGGFTVFGQKLVLSERTLLDKVAVLYGGIAAETIVFGKNMTSSGSSQDILEATSLVADAVKEWGLFSGSSSLVRNASNSGGESVNTDDSVEINALVEKICMEQRNEAIKCLFLHQGMIKQFSDTLISSGKIEPREMDEILVSNGVVLNADGDSENFLIDEYSAKYEEFFKV